MRVAFHDHFGAGRLIGRALADAGHTLVGVHDQGDIAVLDHDFHQTTCNRHHTVILYPHGGPPITEWDGKPIHPNVRLNLVHAAGTAAVMSLYRFPVPCVPVGWCFSDLAAPRHPDTVRRVLFGPAHPLSNGHRDDDREDLNHRILAELLDSGLEVTVRHWGDRSTTGFDPDLPVKWSQGGSPVHTDIDAADLVVADCTLAHLSVARGAPTVVFGADIPHDSAHEGPPRPPDHWDRYKDLLRYPYDWGDAPFDKLVELVTQPDQKVADWRRRFIGDPFDPALVVRLVEAWG